MPPGDEEFPENIRWSKEDVVISFQPMIIDANL
jgi:hypothetical protein